MGQTREQKVLKQLSGTATIQKFTPIATDMFLPNHSGIRDEVKTHGIVMYGNGTIARNSNNIITSITSRRTLTPTRNASGFITSITDGTRTWTFTRNASGFITIWTM